ncbi:hypothetical protein C7441_12140 [Pseudaminobacter salicylatoxidans]|uniref:Uncharacterized protein n=1 Tax=Pseudaminobacter salicylatoxidans TaxID=93369 RepID=A0A316BP94_PSESE|nr:hypothetical protein [Pseudaminobacter salicylatoxidans]PWJ75258.1 hypothetical protein C7441_12140 [Pseudaminobacter salicylatoxidans]
MKVIIKSQEIEAGDALNRGVDKVRTVMCALFGGEVDERDLDSLAAVLEQALRDFDAVVPVMWEDDK